MTTTTHPPCDVELLHQVVVTSPVQRDAHVSVHLRQLPHALAADPAPTLARPWLIGDLNVGDGIEERAVKTHAGVGVDDADAAHPAVDCADELDGVEARFCRGQHQGLLR